MASPFGNREMATKTHVWRGAVYLESEPGQARILYQRGLGAKREIQCSASAVCSDTCNQGGKKERKKKIDRKKRKGKERKKKGSFWIHYSTFGLSPEVIF